MANVATGQTIPLIVSCPPPSSTGQESDAMLPLFTSNDVKIRQKQTKRLRMASIICCLVGVLCISIGITLLTKYGWAMQSNEERIYLAASIYGIFIFLVGLVASVAGICLVLLLCNVYQAITEAKLYVAKSPLIQLHALCYIKQTLGFHFLSQIPYPRQLPLSGVLASPSATSPPLDQELQTPHRVSPTATATAANIPPDGIIPKASAPPGTMRQFHHSPPLPIQPTGIGDANFGLSHPPSMPSFPSPPHSLPQSFSNPPPYHADTAQPLSYPSDCQPLPEIGFSSYPQ
ncbi:unnamed protein product [Protopolystoma xenopodis]|uniref:Uncharacterized protein n=1 Tax=Protopolystoma xenopodis TaxID=117903 RepID=A0A3S5A698_9PLAT|nr:unnamed protein product [Protopolystoma xenopodis]